MTSAPKREDWSGRDQHWGEADLLQSELPMLIAQDITVALPEPGVLDLEGQRNFFATELWKNEHWVRKTLLFLLFFRISGSPISVSICVEGF